MNIKHGEFCRALSNSFTINLSASPTNGEYNSAADIDKSENVPKHASALIRDVLAQPGGPYSNTPEI